MFKRILEDKNIAHQIAHLINNNNRLNKYYNFNEILNERDSFIVETYGNIVIGCVQIQKQAYTVSEIKRLVVHPKARNRGIAGALIKKAVSLACTPLVYAMIRQNNKASINVFSRCGFYKAGYYTSRMRNILMYVATSDKWKNTNITDYNTRY